MPINPINFLKMRFEPYNYKLDIYHIDRWMCSQCGLVLDYQFDDEHPGWPEYDPSPGTIVSYTEDEYGNVQPEYIDPQEVVVRCPRCGLDIEANPLIPIVVQPFQNISTIANIIAEGEGIRLEFKQARPHTDSIGKTMAAFANTEGGKIRIYQGLYS